MRDPTDDDGQALDKLVKRLMGHATLLRLFNARYIGRIPKREVVWGMGKLIKEGEEEASLAVEQIEEREGH